MEPIIINYGRRSEFIQMLRERGAKQLWLEGVEVGTDHGKYAQQLLEGIPNLVLICVDPWLAYTEGTETHTQEEMDQIYQEVQDRTKGYKCFLERKTSMEKIKEVVDNSLDFVFIDGNHDYEHVFEDIVEWTKKVKPGGIVSGHDYTENKECNYGVIEAVQKYVKENHIAPLFILHKGGKLADCWMFIKQP